MCAFKMGQLMTNLLIYAQRAKSTASASSQPNSIRVILKLLPITDIDKRRARKKMAVGREETSHCVVTQAKTRTSHQRSVTMRILINRHK